MSSKPVVGGLAADVRPGVHRLDLDAKKDSLLYVPETYTQHRPAPLAVMLHGAGGNAGHGLSYLQHLADEYNIIVLAPASKEYSWDIIASDDYGPDVILMDQALSFVFDNYSIDYSRLAIGGFSDGASYALSIGLSNGDLFTHIIAFSPGFYYVIASRGRPEVFISHGTHDDILPIDLCSRRIIKNLDRASVHVLYNEFEGRHEIPAEISSQAVKWFLKDIDG